MHPSLEARAPVHRLLDLGGVLDVGDNADSIRFVDAVAYILRCQEGRGGNWNDTELDHADHRGVPLGHPVEHEQHAVALLDAILPQHVREPVRLRHELVEGALLDDLALLVGDHEGKLGPVIRPPVDDVEAEVEVLRRIDPELLACRLVVRHIRRGQSPIVHRNTPVEKA